MVLEAKEDRRNVTMGQTCNGQDKTRGLRDSRHDQA